MKYSHKKLAAVALMAVTLCIASAYAGKMFGQPRQDAHVILRWNKQTTPDSFDAQVRAGQVVGMSAVMKDGSRLALKAQSKPTCATGCPEGQKLTCWEDHDLQMSICVCGSGGGGGSGNFRFFGDANGDGAVGR